MALVTVTGNAWDHTGKPIPAEQRPELWFRPRRADVAGDALLAGVEVRADLDTATGAFSVRLEAMPGIEYRPVLRWLIDPSQTTEKWAYGYAEWPHLIAPYPGGGAIGDLLQPDKLGELVVYVSRTPPPPAFNGLWLHAGIGDPNDVNQSGTGTLRRVIP